MPVSAATRSRKPSAFDAARQASVAISRRRLAFLDWILSRQMLERGDGALDRGVADAAGRRDALAQPDDPRERIDHAKSVAGRTGDQQAAIVGAEVERRVDAGSAPDCQPGARAARRPPQPILAVVSARPKAVAKPRVIVHPKCLSAATPADEEFPFTETLAAPAGRRNSRSHRTMPNQALSSGYRCVICGGKPRNRAKTGISGIFQCKITRLQLLWKTLSHCKNSASDSRSAARKTTRWCAARANTPTISTCPARPMPGSCAPATPTASSAASTPRPPRPCPACSGSGPAPTSPPPITAPSPAACR